jgi:predicted ribosomally synthesized peptide with nif11-like leader
MKKDPELLTKVKDSAGGLDSVVQLAKDHGYDISVDEAKDYIQSQSRQELSDEQMEALAGGKGHTTSSVTQVQSVQTAVQVTSAATTAEAATTAVVVAEAAVVLT